MRSNFFIVDVVSNSGLTRVASLCGRSMSCTHVADVQAQQAMTIMLPKLRPLLYDPVARVRVAMADLVERVSTLKTLQWWTIVPVVELMGVLASDTSDVGPVVQRLLFSQLIRPDPELDLAVRTLVAAASAVA